MRASPVMKKDIYKTMKKIPVHKSSLKKCPCCQNNLSRKKEYSVVQARLFSSESITTIASQGLYCGRNRCKLYFRHNFVWLGGQKINCMSFNEMKKTGLYFVTSKTAFTMKYLELCYLRLLRAKTRFGQEAAVRQIEMTLTCSGATPPSVIICSMHSKVTPWHAVTQPRSSSSTSTFQPNMS